MSTPPPPGSLPPGPRDSGGPYPAPQPRAPYPPPPSPGGGPPGHAPHGPSGPRPPAAVDGVAVAALVCGVLCFLPALGLVLGLIALRRTGRRGERGRGMAIAGTVLSSLGLALWTASLATGFTDDVWEAVKDGARGDGVLTLREGDCFDSPGGLEGWTSETDRVPCAGEHDGEVFALATLDDGPYPGEEALTGTADERCYALRDTYAMDVWALPNNVDVYYLLPSRESWRHGDRAITCVFGNRDAKAPLTGSLRRDETTLDAHQVTYLKASRLLDRALDGAPEAEYAGDDLPGHREWAGRISEALGEQTGMLREHAWPAGARRPVADLTAVLEKAEREWARAAEAGDVDTYYEHHDSGWELVDPHASVTVRRVLGLATSPPALDDDGGGAVEGVGEV